MLKHLFHQLCWLFKVCSIATTIWGLPPCWPGFYLDNEDAWHWYKSLWQLVWWVVHSSLTSILWPGDWLSTMGSAIVEWDLTSIAKTSPKRLWFQKSHQLDHQIRVAPYIIETELTNPKKGKKKSRIFFSRKIFTQNSSICWNGFYRLCWLFKVCSIATTVWGPPPCWPGFYLVDEDGRHWCESP